MPDMIKINLNHDTLLINHNTTDNTTLASNIVVIGIYNRNPGRSTRISPGNRPIQPSLS